MKLNEHSELLCPHCGGSLHLERVMAYWRNEAAPYTNAVIVGFGEDADARFSEQLESPQRDGVALRFCCERCLVITELTFAQHKRNTQIGWRNVAHQLSAVPV